MALGLAITSIGLDVVLSDLDAVWMQNPAELLEQCVLLSYIDCMRTGWIVGMLVSWI